MKKVIWIIIMAIIGLLSGCSTTAKLTEGMTPDEKAAFLEQREYERQAKRERERDEIRAYIQTCKQSSTHTMVYDGPQSARRPRRGEVFIPRHARISDYHCMRDSDLREWLRRNMGGY